MDPDIIMAMLGNITQEIEGVKSEVSSIRLWMPDEVSTTDIEMKLDRVIELLEELVDKQ